MQSTTFFGQTLRVRSELSPHYHLTRNLREFNFYEPFSGMKVSFHAFIDPKPYDALRMLDALNFERISRIATLGRVLFMEDNEDHAKRLDRSIVTLPNLTLVQESLKIFDKVFEEIIHARQRNIKMAICGSSDWMVVFLTAFSLRFNALNLDMTIQRYSNLLSNRETVACVAAVGSTILELQELYEEYESIRISPEQLNFLSEYAIKEYLLHADDYFFGQLDEDYQISDTSVLSI